MCAQSTTFLNCSISALPFVCSLAEITRSERSLLQAYFRHVDFQGAILCACIIFCFEDVMLIFIANNHTQPLQFDVSKK